MIKIAHLGSYNRNFGDNIALYNVRRVLDEVVDDKIHWTSIDLPTMHPLDFDWEHRMMREWKKKIKAGIGHDRPLRKDEAINLALQNQPSGHYASLEGTKRITEIVEYIVSSAVIEPVVGDNDNQLMFSLADQVSDPVPVFVIETV